MTEVNFKVAKSNFKKMYEQLAEVSKTYKETVINLYSAKAENRTVQGMRKVTTKDGKSLLVLTSPIKDETRRADFLGYNNESFIIMKKSMFQLTVLMNSDDYEYNTHEFNLDPNVIGNLNSTDVKMYIALSIMNDRKLSKEYDYDLIKIMGSELLADKNLFVEDMTEFNVDHGKNMDSFLDNYNETMKLLYLSKSDKSTYGRSYASLDQFNGLIRYNNVFSKKDIAPLSNFYVNTVVQGNDVIMFRNKVNDSNKLYNNTERSSFVETGSIERIKMKSSKQARILAMLLEYNVNQSIIKLIFKLNELFTNKEPLYTHHQIQTETKVRDIYAPQDDLKEISKDLLFILDKILGKKFIHPETKNPKFSVNDYQFAYRKGLSILDNAKVHQDNKYMLKFDIQGFFDNCTWDLVKPKVRPFFKEYTSSEYMPMYTAPIYRIIKTSLFLLLINPATGGLYQGNPLSGLISNSIIQGSARFMRNLFAKEDIAFTIYADDITVSSDRRINLNSSLGKIKHAFDVYNLPFILKEEKTKRVSNNRRKVTGVVINHNDEVTIPRKKYMLLKSVLHNLENDKPITLNKHELNGLLSYCKHIDSSGKIQRLVDRYGLVINEYIKSYNENNQDSNVDKDSEKQKLEQVDFLFNN